MQTIVCPYNFPSLPEMKRHTPMLIAGNWAGKKISEFATRYSLIFKWPPENPEITHLRRTARLQATSSIP